MVVSNGIELLFLRDDPPDTVGDLPDANIPHCLFLLRNADNETHLRFELGHNLISEDCVSPRS